MHSQTTSLLLGLFTLQMASMAAAAAQTASTKAPTAAAAPMTTSSTATTTAAADDPNLWLEDVTSDKALGWARTQNARSQSELEAVPGFGPLRDRLRAIYDSKDKIPTPQVMGSWIYNFWKDEVNPRGLWRRTTLAEFKKAQPSWEVVIDVDTLAKTDNEGWVWHGATCLFPKYRRCLVNLSRGGADANVVREFDTVKKAFVDGGFALPEAKSQVAWKDLDTIYVGTDFGPGSLTTSGYPRIAKEWKRGTPLVDAKTLYEGKDSDVSISAYREFDHGKVRDWVGRSPSFFTNEAMLVEGGKLVKIEKPDDAEVDTWHDQLLIRLRTDWKIGDKVWPGGALLAIALTDFRAGKRDFALLFEPTPRTSLDAYSATKSAIYVVELDDVKSVLYLHTPSQQGFTRKKIDAPAVGSFSVDAYDENNSDDIWFTESGFTTPATLSLGSVKSAVRVRLKQAPRFFNDEGTATTQHFAISKDGTRVPYFQVANKSVAIDGTAPTLMTGYGGFEISLLPTYNATAGAAWVERGGVYVVANIRGGGEYGPSWHQAALKHNRQRAYDDFIAVAEDLVSRKVTSSAKLGIMGGSNGGLLMGVMMTQRPDLFGAIVCQVPLLDMKRYHKLLAGASWMEEYGDPEQPDDWAALAKFSPYQSGRDLSPHPVHDVDERRSCAPGPRAQNGRAPAREQTRPPVLREHRRGSRWRRQQRAARLHVRRVLCLPGQSARPALSRRC